MLDVSRMAAISGLLVIGSCHARGYPLADLVFPRMVVPAVAGHSGSVNFRSDVSLIFTRVQRLVSRDVVESGYTVEYRSLFAVPGTDTWHWRTPGTIDMVTAYSVGATARAAMTGILLMCSKRACVMKRRAGQAASFAIAFRL